MGDRQIQEDKLQIIMEDERHILMRKTKTKEDL